MLLQDILHIIFLGSVLVHGIASGGIFSGGLGLGLGLRIVYLAGNGILGCFLAWCFRSEVLDWKRCCI